MGFNLSQFLKFSNGKKRPLSDGEIPVYGGNGILGYCNEANASDCIVIGRVGAYCGSVYYERGPCWISDNAIKAEVQPGHDIRFMYYLLSNLNLQKRQQGTSQPLLTQGLLNAIEVENPPSFEVQKKVAALLGAIEEKIRANSELNDYLLEAAKALLTEKVYTEKPYGTTTVREFVKSMSNGATPSRKKDEYWNDGTIPWVKTGEVNNNLIFETSEHVTELALEKTSIRLLPKDTLVMALYGSGTAGRLALLKTPATTNQACTAMVCNSAVESFYLFLTLQGMYREIDSLTRGSVQQNLSKDIVADLEIPNVTEEALEAFNLKRFYDLIALNEQGSLYLAELRDALLPKLMSGEIDVSKVDLTQLNNHLTLRRISRSRKIAG